MAKRFYGSVEAYDRGLEAGDDSALSLALERNVLGREGEPTQAAKALALYLRREIRALESAGDGDLLAGRIGFGRPAET
jgi:cytochrome b pre-mRNA-processing protein 3